MSAHAAVARVLLLLAVVVIGAGGTPPCRADPPIEGLDFPIADSSVLARSSCYGLRPWDSPGGDEIHDGIDLVPHGLSDASSISRVPVVAVADARVERIVEAFSGAGAAEVIVVLSMSRYWYLAYSFEPQTADAGVFALQRSAIAVREGQRVRRGEPIGELVFGAVLPGSSAHLHLSLLYKHRDDTLDSLFQNAIAIRRSDGTDLVPASGKGSPWQPRDLGLPSTFYCPYEYSSASARARYDALPRMAANGDSCRCICAYGSAAGDCGRCGAL